MQILHFCKKHIWLILLHTICLIGIITASCKIAKEKKESYEQNMAERWSDDDMSYHQITAFTKAMSLEDISRLRNQIAMGLSAASYTDETVTGRLWVDAYSAQIEDGVCRNSDLGIVFQNDVQIMGVSGDFFQFHPLKMISGCTFSSDDVMHDRVVLDKQLAWTLFGAYDVAGKQVQINGKSFTVSGVYEVEDDKLEKYVRNNKSYVYLDFDAFHTLYEDVPITCYEIVLPNAVKNFARNLVKDNMDKSAKIIDNTERFDTWKLLVKYKSIKKNLMHREQINYPYWENEAVAVEWNIFIFLWMRIALIASLVSYWIIQLRKVTSFRMSNFCETD